jgi:signal transduction histidine kinase
MGTSTHAVTDPSLIRFARRLSHDLNNYATVVRTYSELLLADLPPDSPSRADVEEIQRAAEGTVAYIQRVTRFSRAGMMRRGPVSVDDTLADLAASAAAECPGRAVTVQSATAASVATDAPWFRDALLELLRNAHDAAPAGTAIRVEAHVQASLVAVRVADAGPGASGDAGDLFEPFTSTKQGVRGAGQGLAMVKAFALAGGGDLTIERVNDETVVTLTLPLAAPDTP